MSKVYPTLAGNPLGILQIIKNDDTYTQDWWQCFAFTRDFARSLGLTRTDLAWLDSVMRHVSLDKHGAAKKVFPSQERIAEMMQCCVRTVRRCQEKFVKLGWVLVETRRARKAQPEGGQWASNYYDLKPLYALHTRISATIKARNERTRKARAEAVQGAHRGTPESPRGVAATQMAGDDTGGHGCPPNKNQPANIVKQNKPKDAPTQSTSTKRALTDDERFVLSRLTSLGYTEQKGDYDIRRHGAARVLQAVEAVTKFCSGVKDVPRLINHYMTRPLPTAYVKAKDDAWQQHQETEKEAQSVVSDMLPPVPQGVDVDRARDQFAGLPQHERNAIVAAGKAEARRQCRVLDALAKAERDERISRHILLAFLARVGIAADARAA